MKTASSYGLKVGDKIRYLGEELGWRHHEFNIGDVLVLAIDDFNEFPRFSRVGETARHSFFLGRKWGRVEGEKDVKLEHTKEYSVMLTWEELVVCTAIIGSTLGDVPRSTIYKAYCRMLALSGFYNNVFEDCPIPDYRIDGDIISRWLDSIFESPEAEDERKLRELKEQYESLGKAIEAMEKK